MINPLYLVPDIQSEMRNSFVSALPQVISIPNFLVLQIYSELAKNWDSGRGVHKKVPSQFSFFEVPPGQEVERVFSSVDFLGVLSVVLKRKVSSVSLSVRRFGQGDYSVVHDALPALLSVRFFFVFSPSVWPSDAGGQVVCVHPRSEPLVFPPSGNSLNIVRAPRYRFFVKYVNHRAGDKSLVLLEGVVK